LSDKEKQKKLAAIAALEHIENDQVIGIGSGSTVEYFIKILKDRIFTEKLKIQAVPTSYQSAFLLIQNKIPLTTLNEHPELDLAIDGADEIDPELNLIKGGGAALTQEKIVDSMAKKFIVIADESKKVNKLGEKMPIPIEVIPLSLETVLLRLRKMGFTCTLREAIKKLGPVITDNGNFIVDGVIDDIQNPKKIELEINGIPGVVENGLFIEMTHIAYIGSEKGIIKLVR